MPRLLKTLSNRSSGRCDTQTNEFQSHLFEKKENETIRKILPFPSIIIQILDPLLASCMSVNFKCCIFLFFGAIITFKLSLTQHMTNKKSKT